ncbi:MAG: hypothetical protein JF601_06020 [Acidobacteria bacterium]|nr:hypothetical protein [Acidobacteriota bacterium]
MGDLDRVANRLVLERQLCIEVLELLRHRHAARAHRRVDRDFAVGNLDRVDRDRLARTAAVGFGLLLLDQPAQLPGVAVAPQVDDRFIQPDLVNRQALRDQFEDVVLQAEILDGDHLAAAHRDADVLHLDAEEQVAAEALDRQRAVQVLVRLRDDEAAQPVLEPGRLRHDHRGRRRPDDERQHEDQNVSKTSDNPHLP